MSDHEYKHEPEPDSERDYQRIKELLKSLPLEERLKLFQSDLSKHGLNIVITGSTYTTAHICMNITSSKELDISELLFSIAAYLEKTEK